MGGRRMPDRFTMRNPGRKPPGKAVKRKPDRQPAPKGGGPPPPSPKVKPPPYLGETRAFQICTAGFPKGQKIGVRERRELCFRNVHERMAFHFNSIATSLRISQPFHTIPKEPPRDTFAYGKKEGRCLPASGCVLLHSHYFAIARHV